jgi:hypothetical protein
MDALELEAAEHIANTRVALGSRMIAAGAYEDAKVAFGSVLRLGDSPSKSTIEAARRGLAEAEAGEYMSPEDLAGHGVYSLPVAVEEVQALLETDGPSRVSTQLRRHSSAPVSPLSRTASTSAALSRTASTSAASTPPRHSAKAVVSVTQPSVDGVLDGASDCGATTVERSGGGSEGGSMLQRYSGEIEIG